MGVVACTVNGQTGLNVAIYARHATAVEVCL